MEVETGEDVITNLSAIGLTKQGMLYFTFGCLWETKSFNWTEI